MRIPLKRTINFLLVIEKYPDSINVILGLVKYLSENNVPIFRISSEPRQKYGLNQTKNK